MEHISDEEFKEMFAELGLIGQQINDVERQHGSHPLITETRQRILNCYAMLEKRRAYQAAPAAGQAN